MKYFIFILSVLTLLASCEEDDICLDGKTPQLYLKFQNQSPLTEGRMDSLIVYRKEANGNFEMVLAKAQLNAIDSTKVSLRIDEVNQTELILTTRRNESALYDTLRINYDRNVVYGSKACGYKVNYIQAEYSITQQFFVDKEELDTNITNEEAPHLLLYY